MPTPHQRKPPKKKVLPPGFFTAVAVVYHTTATNSFHVTAHTTKGHATLQSKGDVHHHTWLVEFQVIDADKPAQSQLIFQNIQDLGGS